MRTLLLYIVANNTLIHKLNKEQFPLKTLKSLVLCVVLLSALDNNKNNSFAIYSPLESSHRLLPNISTLRAQCPLWQQSDDREEERMPQPQDPQFSTDYWTECSRCVRVFGSHVCGSSSDCADNRYYSNRLFYIVNNEVPL